MNREYIFRGKRWDTDEWVEGYYVCLNGTQHRIYNGYAETDCGNYYPDWYEVIPETVERSVNSKTSRHRGSKYKLAMCNVIRGMLEV